MMDKINVLVVVLCTFIISFSMISIYGFIISNFPLLLKAFSISVLFALIFFTILVIYHILRGDEDWIPM